MVSSEERAYLAGFLDGEGAIMLRSSNGYIRLDVKVTNTNWGLLIDFQSVWGGTIYRAKGRSLLHKPVYKLSFNSREAVEMLQSIALYIRLKKKQCEIALRFAKTIKHNGPKGGLALGDKEAREQMMAEMKALNHRGTLVLIGAG